MELCVAVLELLQWKEDIDSEAELLGPLTKVLEQLLSTPPQPESPSLATDSHTRPAAMADSDEDDEDAGDEEDEPSNASAGAATRWA